MNSSVEPDFVTMVKDVLFSLSISPGLFEDYMKSMVEHLNAVIRSNAELGVVADIIFEQVNRLFSNHLALAKSTARVPRKWLLLHQPVALTSAHLGYYPTEAVTFQSTKGSPRIKYC